MIGILIILATALLFGRESNSDDSNEKSSNSESSYLPTKTGSFVNYSSGYDPIRDVHWTKKDTFNISEF